MATKRKTTASTRRSNGRRYTEAEKAVAIQTVRATGSTVTLESLKNVQLLLKAPGLSFNTLVAWFKTAANAPKVAKSTSPIGSAESTQVDAELNASMAALEMWRVARIAYLQRATTKDAIEKTDGKDAIAAAERAQKMEQLLAGMPTEIVGGISILNEIIAFVRENHLNFNDAQQQFLEMLRAKKPATNDVQGGDA